MTQAAGRGLHPWHLPSFAVREVDGHDVEALRSGLAQIPFEPGRPGILICHTIKGKGIRTLEGNASWHHKNQVTEDEVRTLLAGLEEA